MLSINQTITLTCGALGADFEGICRHDGQVVFVCGALPGETVHVKIEKVGKKSAVGKLLDIVERSPERADPPCAVFPRCGGCVALHMNYQATLRHKRQQVIDCLSRIGGIGTPDVLPVIGMERPWWYRNKAAFPVGGSPCHPCIGCYAEHSHEIVDVKNGCLLQSESSDALVLAVRRWMMKNAIAPYDEKNHTGLLRHIVTREAFDGGVMLILVINGTHGDRLPATEDLIASAKDAVSNISTNVKDAVGGFIASSKGAAGDVITDTKDPASGLITNTNGAVGNFIANSKGAADDRITGTKKAVPTLRSVVVCENTRRTNVIFGETFHTLWGDDVLIDEIAGFQMRVSPRSFFQVNREQAEKLFELAVSFAGLTGGERVWDVYCGCGSITLPLARKAAFVTGIEVVEDAVRDARENALRNGVRNVSFICGAAEAILPSLAAWEGAPDVIVVDPPRKGCDEKALAAIAAAAPARIVYVSCNPATLSRDVAFLSGHGYGLQRVQPVDLFAWTGHVECVALLGRC